MGFEEIIEALEYNITSLESANEKLKSDEKINSREYFLSLTESQIDLNKALIELMNKLGNVMDKADITVKMIDSIKDKAKKKKRRMGDFYS